MVDIAVASEGKDGCERKVGLGPATAGYKLRL